MTYVPFTNGDTVDYDIAGSVYRFLVGYLPPPEIYSVDNSTQANNFRKRNLLKELGDGFVVGVDVPYTAVDPNRFQVASAGLREGLVDCTQGGVWPAQDNPQTENGNNTTGRPAFGVNIGHSNLEELGRVEGENCQNFMLYMPRKAVNAPIFIYIPGGGGDRGGSQALIYWAARLGLEIIVMVPNYRRAWFGGFYHPDQDETQLNFCMSDIKAMFQWASLYGGYLGGDVNNITVGGSSFGGALTLAAAEDTSINSLIKNYIVISGAGAGERRTTGLSRRGSNMGYDLLCSRFADRLNGVAPYMYTEDGELISDLISSDGEWFTIQNKVPMEYFIADHDDRNIFLWRDNVVLKTRNAVAFAESGLWPPNTNVMIVTTLDESSVLDNGVTDVSDIDFDAYSRFAGFDDFEEVEAESYWTTYLSNADPSAPDADYRDGMTLYSNSLYWAPAKRMAEALTVSQPKCYLVLDNYVSQGVNWRYTPHTSIVAYMLGQPTNEWKVGMDGDEAKVYARDVFYSEGLVQLIKTFCTTGQAEVPEPLRVKYFDADPDFTLTEYNVSDENWNITGSPDYNATSAAAQIQSINGGFGTWFNDMVNDFASRIETDD